MMAATRVERLKYKEIQTPTWRTVAEYDEELVPAAETAMVKAAEAAAVEAGDEEQGEEDITDGFFEVGACYLRDDALRCRCSSTSSL